MALNTPIHALPLLAPGQANKELTHNEALTLLDMLCHTAVEAVAPASAPPSPEPGQCWVVGAGATGAWAGRDSALACWTEGGWRFVAAREGMTVWSIADSLPACFSGGTWTVGTIRAGEVRIGGVRVIGAQGAAISEPTGGTIVDSEARFALGAVISALRSHGLIAS